jgi:hypothetical protein
MEMTMADKPKPIERQNELTPVQRLAEIDKQRAELAATIKEAALKKANDAVAELIALGYHFELAERTVASGAKKRFPSDATCSVCNFKTTPAHDKRTHKKHPEAFTDEELKARNLVRI